MSESASATVARRDAAASADAPVSSRARQGPRGDACLPTLFDRLTGDAGAARDGHTQISRAAYQETVLRDLRWLLNCASTATAEDLRNHSQLRNSVLNYGIPSFAGGNLSESDLESVARGIERAILDFEPRILADSLTVTLIRDSRPALGNQLAFRIKAAFWFEPYALDLSLRARWEVDGGLVALEGE